MGIDERLLLQKYVAPVVLVDVEGTILFANEDAVRLWGNVDGKKCHEFIYKRQSECPLCVRKDLDANGWSGMIRRSRLIKDKNGNEIEHQAIVTPYEMDALGKCHMEIYTSVPEATRGTRAIMRFAELLEELAEPNDIMGKLVEFLSSDQTDLRCRTRCYTLKPGKPKDELRLVFRDHRSDPPPYVKDIDERVIRRSPSADFNASFACLDQKRWFLMAPDSKKLDAFKVHFRAQPHDAKKRLWNTNPAVVQQQITLYLYDKEKDGIVDIFEDKRPHTFLDIPIRTQKNTYGKISLSLWQNSFLFYREHIEELRLIENFVIRRLVAIESLDEAKAAVAQNVIHEVSQPAFAGLASMEALRRRDRENGRTASDEQVDFYLKKNVECSLKMVAFLNDRGRISEDLSSFSDTPTNFLSDVLAPVVNLTRFGIYEKYLRDSGEKMDPSELEDIPVRYFRSSQSVKSVFDGITYEIAYGGRCDEITVYIEKYRLQQVVYNLLNNALKYKGRGYDYRVRIQYRPELNSREQKLFADYFVIDVTDEGYGIEEDEKEKIFGLCVQGRNARKVSKLPGTGRGLYVCRAIIRGVGGDVFVQTLRSPTVFRILIPRECESDAWLSKVEHLRERTREIRSQLIDGE